MSLFNNFPYANSEEINLDYTLKKLNELYSRGENLYDELQAWKTETDKANTAWKSDLLSDINEWQNSVTHSLEEWKTSVDSEVSNALTTLSKQITEELAQAKIDLRAEVADLASRAATSAANAATSAANAAASQSTAAQSAQSAINSAAAAAQSEQNISESAEQIETNKNDITDLKSAINFEFPYSWWAIGSISAADGALYSNDTRRRSYFAVDSSVINSITIADANVTMQIFAWNSSGYVGTWKTNNTFEKSSTNIAWIKSWNLYDYPQYSFGFVLKSENDTFDFTQIKVITTKEDARINSVNGFLSIGAWEKYGINGNAGDAASINSSTKRAHIIISDIRYINKIRYNEGYAGYAKIIDSNNIVVTQLNSSGIYAYIPNEYQKNTDYKLGITVQNSTDTTLSLTNAGKAITIYPKDITEKSIVLDIYKYNGNKISLQENTFGVIMGPMIPFVSGYHKQGCASYGDLLVQFYSDDMVKLINIQTGELINTFTPNTGHGSSAQFSNEFLNPDDKYPLLYFSEEINQDYIQVIHVTDDTWEMVRKIPCPIPSHVCIDNDANRLIVVSYDTSATPYKPTLRAYDLWQPLTVEGIVYTYPLVCEVPLQPMVIKQCIMMHNGMLYYLTSYTRGDEVGYHRTWLYTLNPYTGEVINIIKDFPAALAGNSTASEVEGMTIYYDKRYNKNLLMLIPSGASGTWNPSYCIDFDV